MAVREDAELIPEEPAHVLDGGPCWCNPRVKHYPDGDLIIHRSIVEIMTGVGSDEWEALKPV